MTRKAQPFSSKQLPVTESAVSVGAGRDLPPHIVIVGGCGGIGRELIRSLLRQQCDISILDLPVSIERHPPPEAVRAFSVDATDASAVKQVVVDIQNQSGAVHGFVYLAGFMPELLALDNTPESVLRNSLEVNLLTAWQTTTAFLPLLRAARNSAVVLAASGLGAYARPGMGSYSIAKAGIIAMTRQFALEQAPDVRINAVAPAAVDTAFLRGGTGRSLEDEEPHVDIDGYKTIVPLQRIAQPDDVTGPIEFLLSSASKYMTGQTLYINGGTYTG